MKRGRKICSILLALVLCLSLFPSTASAISSQDVSIKKTDIKADGVFNTGGYGSIQIEGKGNLFGDGTAGTVTPPKAALIDREGKMIFPYKETSMRYRYLDGIVSLSEISPYTSTNVYSDEIYQAGYYTLDGENAFTLKKEGSVFTGTPLQDGYVLIVERADDGPYSFAYHTYIMDKSGKITCTLPEEFNQVDVVGMMGYTPRRSIGWCGEGLFAYFSNETDMTTYICNTVGLGYMDHTGKTVIDLSDRGYTDMGPFHEGLAWVKTSAGKYGFINRTGELVIPCTYDFADNFCDGVAPVGQNGKYGYIDKSDNKVVPFEYDGVYGAGGGLASVVKNDTCGLVDYNNNIVIPFEYDDIASFEDGVAYAIKGGIVYIITAGNTPSQPAWYDEAVKFVTENNLMTGTNKGFEPNVKLSRGMLAQILYNKEGKPVVSSSNIFSDIKADAWYANAVTWAAEKGIVSGYSDGSFGPNDNISREQLVTMLWRYDGAKKSTIELNAFSDADQVSGYAHDALCWAVERGVIRGHSNGTIDPKGQATRAEVAQMLMNYLSK